MRRGSASGRLGRGLALVCGAALLVPAPAGAQAGFTTFQFNLSNPGARSMGFGGAFVALADDATAAFANPAGLVQIIAPEVSLEGRSWSYSTPYTVGGRLSGEPSGFGLDTISGLRFGVSEQDAAGLAFLSLVYPKGRWSWAFYRHRLSNFTFAGETQGLFAIPFPPDTGFRREGDRRLATEYDIVGYGLSGAWQVADKLSVGLGAVYFEVGLSASERHFAFDSEERFFEANSYLPARNFQNVLFEIDESDWGMTAGFLWSPSARWRLGGTYREGPEVDDFRVTIRSGPSDPSVPVGTTLFAASSPLALPDTWGLGLSYRSADDRLTLGLEWDRVEYSQIVESITFATEAVVDDADELHAGAELVLLERRPVVALRAG
ncbi:MAG: outer membrane protein transport protein, partial [Acidobacteriota bacterium]|nr:outer membrane protein transport protein [Acidobacteriota bacterium]